MRPSTSDDRLFVFARHDLVGPRSACDAPALLLEGSWPDAPSPHARWSLDDAIDARFGWIDRAATELAEQAGNHCRFALREKASARGGNQDVRCLRDPDDRDAPSVHPAWLNALALRYYLVKLIRLVAYFTEVRPLSAGDCVEFAAARGRDDDYADCLAELCRRAGADFRIEWIDRLQPAAQAFPPNGGWRRGLARLCRLLGPPTGMGGAHRRVVLCGNPRFLDPVCRAILERHCRVWWLYDRFAVRSWLRWWLSGVGQLVCESSAAGENRLAPDVPERLACRGVNLAKPVARWLAERIATHGPRQTRLVERIDAHFRRVRPHALVLDQDGTPMARAAAALARRHGAASWVVQHGAPVCRFGFAPLAAGRILVWGRSSQDQLTRWGVPAERIRVVGSPGHERRRRDGWLTANTSLPLPGTIRILLLATTPPREDRPDAVAMHFTRRTYAEMLRTALAGVSEIPGAELIVKLHPRAPDDPIVHAVLAEFPLLRCRIVAGGPVEPWFGHVACVLSCFSSAGIDATLADVPVIQLLPAGSGDLLPHRAWGTLGSARNEDELQRLLVRAFNDRRSRPPWVRRVRGARGSDAASADDRQPKPTANPNVFADLGASAAARVADAVLAARPIQRAGEPASGAATPDESRESLTPTLAPLESR